MKIKSFFIVIGIFILFSIYTKSQDFENLYPYNKLQYGLFGHYQLVYQSADFQQLPNIPNCCPHFTNGSGNGFDAGLLLDIPFKESFMFTFRLGYEKNNSELSEIETETFGYNNKEYIGDIEHRIYTNFESVFAELLFGYRIIEPLILNIGLHSGYILSAKCDQEELLIKPEDFGTFENGKRVRNYYYDIDIPLALKYSFGLVGGISYEFPLNKKKTVRLAPELFANLNFTPIVEDYSWYQHSVRLGCALKFSSANSYPLDIDINSIEPIQINEYKSCNSNKYNFITREFQLYPKAKSKIGVKSWNLDLINNGNIIKNYKGQGLPPERINISIIDDSISYYNNPKNWNYILSVKDNFDNEEKIAKPISINKTLYNLESSISAKGISTNKNQDNDTLLKIERTLSVNMNPLLNYVFFDESSTEIPQRYSIISADETNNFNINNLHNENTLSTYSHILNIIGLRLRQNPEARIKLVGCNSGVGKEKNRSDLALKRAEAVKKYLKDVWNIPNKQMYTDIYEDEFGAPRKPTLKGKENDSAEANAENRRVEIIPDKEFYSIIEPVLTHDTIVKISYSNILFYPVVNSNSKIKSWKLTLKRNDLPFAEFTGNDNIPENIALDIKDKITEMQRESGSLDYSFYVDDIHGQYCQTDGKFPYICITKDSTFDKYSLILFEFNKFDITPANKSIVDIIRNSIEDGAIVSVIGSTDIVGDNLTNLRLSKNRAMHTTNNLLKTDLFNNLDFPISDENNTMIIKNRDIKFKTNDGIEKSANFTISGTGEQLPLLYDNSYPEGRFYCRTVTFEIRNPLKQK